MRVELSQRARLDIAEVWRWNAKRYGIDHAESYAEFLEAKMDELGPDPPAGRRVAGRPNLLQLTTRRSPGGHGHIAFYRVEENAIQIVRVLHTAQDWPKRLEDTEPLGLSAYSFFALAGGAFGPPGALVG